MTSWQKIHPDWQYRLWTDADVPGFKLINQKYYDASPNYGQRSDILRYEILCRYGGLYIDTDFECLQRFDVLHHCYDFYTGLSNSGQLDLAMGLIGSVPGHPILKELIKSMKPLPKKFTHVDILNLTGPGYFLDCFLKVAKTCEDRTIAFPSSFFYPSPNLLCKSSKEGQRKFIKGESFAIHYWSCSWMEKTAFVPGMIKAQSPEKKA